MNQFRSTYAEINLKNLISNLILLRKNSGNLFFCPMVKANAYGHGDFAVSQALAQNGVNYFGVGFIEEALKLRNQGFQKDILVFGIFDEQGAQEIVQQNFIPVLSDWHQLHSLNKAFSSTPNAKSLRVHLKFDTGMHRLGFNPSEAQKLESFLKQNLQFNLQGICTHLYQSEDLLDSKGFSAEQLQKYSDLLKIFNQDSLQNHVFNSAGLINLQKLQNQDSQRFQSYQHWGSRPGISLYGENHQGLDLKPVMSLKSCFVKFHKLKTGESVSYGATWRASKNSTIGVLPIGYADGYARRLSNQGEVLYRGMRLPVVGTVCMDYIMINLTSVEEQLSVNFDSLNPLQEEVILMGQDQFGNHVSASDLAKKLGTIPYEVLTDCGVRVPRRYIDWR